MAKFEEYWQEVGRFVDQRKGKKKKKNQRAWFFHGGIISDHRLGQILSSIWSRLVP